MDKIVRIGDWFDYNKTSIKEAYGMDGDFIVKARIFKVYICFDLNYSKWFVRYNLFK